MNKVIIVAEVDEDICAELASYPSRRVKFISFVNWKDPNITKIVYDAIKDYNKELLLGNRES